MGVIALFARGSLPSATLEAMASAADGIALGIEQMRANEALRDSEAKLQAIVNNAIDAIITIDVEGTVLSFNPSAERVFGYPADEVLGRNVSRLMPLRTARSTTTTWPGTSEPEGAGSSALGRELLAQRRDGTVFPVEIGVSEIQVEGKAIFVGILRDISERRAAVEEIRNLNAGLELTVARRTAELESMLANATIGLAFFDRQLRFLRVNRHLAEYTGIPVEEFLGRTLRELDASLPIRSNRSFTRFSRLARPSSDWSIPSAGSPHPTRSARCWRAISPWSMPRER